VFDRARNALKPYKDILVYHDYGPLLLFWNISDIFNNRILWMSYSDALGSGQEWAYAQYVLYFIVAIGMLVSLPNVKRCAKFVGAYLLLYIFSTTRFLYMVATEPNFMEGDIGRSLVVTGVYFTLWVWIYWKMRLEMIHKDINNG
jgi:hypothetical protein